MTFLRNLISAARTTAVMISVLTLLTLSGCQKSSINRGDAAAQKSSQTRTAPSPTPEANVFADEAMLAKPYAIIGGAVENVGARKLEKLSVEIELRRRDDGAFETREVAVEPSDLEPGKRGKFSLKVLSEEWSGSRVVKLRSGPHPQEVAFKVLPGAKRPPEKIKENVIVVKTPAQKRPNGSEFINTPDTPYSVP